MTMEGAVGLVETMAMSEAVVDPMSVLRDGGAAAEDELKPPPALSAEPSLTLYSSNSSSKEPSAGVFAAGRSGSALYGHWALRGR